MQAGRTRTQSQLARCAQAGAGESLVSLRVCSAEIRCRLSGSQPVISPRHPLRHPPRLRCDVPPREPRKTSSCIIIFHRSHASSSSSSPNCANPPSPPPPPFPPLPCHMSRHASESVGAVKRTRTLSSCADSVEPPYACHDLPPLPPAPVPPPAQVQPLSHLQKRSLSSGTLHPNPPAGRQRKRGRVTADAAPLNAPSNLPAPLYYLQYNLPYSNHPYSQNQSQHHNATYLPPANRHPQSHSHYEHHHPPSLHPNEPKRRSNYPPTPTHLQTHLPSAHPAPLSTRHHHAQHRSARHTREYPSNRQGPALPPPGSSELPSIIVDPPARSHRVQDTRPARPPVRRDRNPASSASQRQHPPRQEYPLPCEDDAEGHLIYKLGEGLHPNSEFPNGRYKILLDLGEGTFGKVVECWDRRECQRVAIKIVRSVNKYREAARLEIDVLQHLNTHDPEGYYHCVKLYSWFDYRSHVCMVFEKLGPSLYEQLRRNRFRPFPLDQVREYAFQLLESVNFVHSLTLIHTDLKPENILLLNSKRSNAIKLIDFGSATFESQHHSAVISTRHYRAPEVILGLGWTYPCDLWSIGCILVELYTGQALFQTHENLEHLAMMSGVLGPIPDSMIRRADGSGQKYFIRSKGGRRALNWPGGASSTASVRSVRKVQSLQDIIRGHDAHSNFFDLVRRLLAFEPDTRCTSAEALRHPFFRETPHESDPPLTTPTLSSGSSACGSHSVVRGRNKGTTQRRPAKEKLSSRNGGCRGRENERLEDDGDDTATEMPIATEHSDHTIVAAPLSPRRDTNVDVS